MGKDSARKFVTCRLVMGIRRSDTEMSWRYREITSSFLGFNKYLRRSSKYERICDAEECRKLAVCFRSEAGSCSRYLEISFKKVEITQLSYMPSWKTFWGQKCVVKFESEEISITGDDCSKSDSKRYGRLRTGGPSVI